MNLLPQPDNPAKEMHLSILKCLVKDLKKTKGNDAINGLAKVGNLDLQRLLGGKGWVSFEQMDAMAEAALHFHDDDEERFRQVCANGMQNAYGALRYVLFASSPRFLFSKAINSIGLVSRISSWEILHMGSASAHAKYFSEKKEGRALCLIRQANIMALPTLWGLPSAQLDEHKCIAWGDQSCEFKVRWTTPWRWLWIILTPAFSASVILWLSTSFAFAKSWALLATLVSLGGSLAFEWRRQQRANKEYREGIEASLTQMIQAENDTREEIEALRIREAHWQRDLEQALAEHQNVLQQMREKLGQLREEQVVELHHYTHDIRNPLTGFQMLIELLSEEQEKLSKDGRWALKQQSIALKRIHDMLDNLLQTADQANAAHRYEIQDIDVVKLKENYTKRLRAFVGKGQVRASVFGDREMPKVIKNDLLRVERVLDNIISNAAKYTKHGHILMRFSGRPGFLEIKVHDTGLGMSSERLNKIFLNKPTPSNDKKVHSVGLGLSVTVRVLDEIGGRVEVMSEPGEGSTFWIFIPIEVKDINNPQKDEDEGQMLARVVNIRKSSKF